MDVNLNKFLVSSCIFLMLSNLGNANQVSFLSLVVLIFQPLKITV